MSGTGRHATEEQAELRVLVTGGGSGGHINPGLALVEEIRAVEARSRFLWVGTSDRLEAELVPRANIPIEFIDVAYIKGRNLLGKLSAILQLPLALLKSIRLIRRFRPHVVVGVGGFVSGPVGFVASLMGYPTALLEQNARPGLTNRLLGRFAKRVFVSFEESRTWFSPRKVRLLGNPVRPNLLTGGSEDEARGRAVKVLIIGGSQGAALFNCELPDVLSEVREKGVELVVRHSSGKGRDEAVREAYAGADWAEVLPYIHDMGACYRWADVVICRAGASTIAELAVVGKAAVFVPFPFASDNHQHCNAQAMVDAGAGILLTEEQFRKAPPVERLVEMLSDIKRLVEMGNSARSMGHPGAGKAIAEEIIGMVR
jgi:UDP-N-acetylglucosamine--N-acetylmuramyl-(pentapeptide) pyrophosphoryl-undecaprenol N-acetylglucosamine transferase